MKPENIETATSRDIIAEFHPEHAWHSLNGAEKKTLLGDTTVTLMCSCKESLVVPPEIIKEKGFDVKAIVRRLEKLSQLGRPQ